MAARFERYSDFGSRLTGKAAVRFQPSRRLTFRAAASTGFRAPGLSQEFFSKVVSNVIAGQAVDIGILPVDTRRPSRSAPSLSRRRPRSTSAAGWR